MTGISRTTDGLDPRRKRILFRAWHRGTREMDLLFGRFVEATIDGLDEAELAELEALIEESDRDLFAWLSGAEPVVTARDTALFRAMKAYHNHSTPLDL